MKTIIEYLDYKGWNYKQNGQEIILQICPYCKNEKWHFYLSVDGPFFCHKCNEKGHINELKKCLGDYEPLTQRRTKKPFNHISPAFNKTSFKFLNQSLAGKHYNELLKHDKALKYLESRGITKESIDTFKLGVMSDKDGDWISIPHYRASKLINIKYRHVPPTPKDLKKYKRSDDCESILFNCDVIKSAKEIYITEGELDGISLMQQGIKNVVSGTVGAKTFKPEWIDEFKEIEKIYIAYDPDEDGQVGAKKTAKKLDYDRCFNIELPEGYDINKFFNNGADLCSWQSLVDESKKIDLPGIIHLRAAFELLGDEFIRNDGCDTSIKTPWVNVNSLVNGFSPGDLIILTAYPKIGKTSFCLDISRCLMLDDIPVLFYCLEMRPERLLKKLIAAQYRVPTDDVTAAHLIKAEVEFRDKPLYFSHSFKKEKIEDVLGLIRDAIKRFELKIVIFDNIHFLVRSITNVNEELGQAVQGFKLLAEEMQIPIICVAQPRKRESGQSNSIMGADDVKYSNSIHADCDQMIILHRNRIASKSKEIGKDTFEGKTEAYDPVTLVRVEAHRYGAGGETLLYYHGEYSRFDLIERKKMPF